MRESTLAVIVPILNEAPRISGLLAALADHDLDELILVDGGSDDDSYGTARALAASCRQVRVLRAPQGRARQMNAGAGCTRAEILVFLHADTRLPHGAEMLIREALATPVATWGRFDVRFEPDSPAMRAIAFFMNWRSAITGICTGDQVLFLRRTVFQDAGGYADIPIMEDIELCKRLKHHGRPCRLRATVTSSARRWNQWGVVRTVLTMWWLRLLFWWGVSPVRLATRYRHAR